jgi:hypothetical protein
MKIVINRCHGGFGLSQKAYKWLIDHGMEHRPYITQTRDPVTKRLMHEPRNDGEVIFDPCVGESGYWEMWIRHCKGWKGRVHKLVVRCVEELGDAANGDHARLKVVEVPDGVEWYVGNYDGVEQVAENHRTWS